MMENVIPTLCVIDCRNKRNELHVFTRAAPCKKGKRTIRAANCTSWLTHGKQSIHTPAVSISNTCANTGLVDSKRVVPSPVCPFGPLPFNNIGQASSDPMSDSKCFLVIVGEYFPLTQAWLTTCQYLIYTWVLRIRHYLC